MSRKAVNARKWQEKAYQEGRCVRCGEPRDDIRTKCAACRAKTNECSKRRRERAGGKRRELKYHNIPMNFETDHLILQWMNRVYQVAHRVKARKPVHVEVDDLIGAGMLALVEAGRRYDFSRGVPFGIWLNRPIHWAIQREANAVRPNIVSLDERSIDLQPRRWRLAA